MGWKARCWKAVAAAMLMLATAATAVPAVAGMPFPKSADRRIIANSRDYPWRAIGRLNRVERGHCSAAVIGPDLVLTAAHCVWDRLRQRVMPVDDLHFVAGWERGDYVFHSTAAKVHMSPRWNPELAGRLDNEAHDWALIELKKDPVPVTGQIPLGRYDRKSFWQYRKSKTVFVQAGYAADRGQVLTVDPHCPMWGFAKGIEIAVHQCIAFPGDSGAPIMYRDPKTGEWRIAAMHVAHERSRIAGNGFAVPAETLVPAVEKLLASRQ